MCVQCSQLSYRVARGAWTPGLCRQICAQWEFRSHKRSFKKWRKFPIILTSKSKGAQDVKSVLQNMLWCHFHHLAVYRCLTFPAGLVSPFPIKTCRGGRGCPPFSDSHRSYLTSSILQWFSLYLHERSFPLLGLEDATEIWTGGSAEVCRG